MVTPNPSPTPGDSPSEPSAPSGVWPILQHWLNDRRARHRAQATVVLWHAMATFRRDTNRPYAELTLTVPEAQKALSKVRRALAHGADAQTPRTMKDMRSAAPRRESMLSLSAMSPLEWAVHNQAWSLADALLDGGVDPAGLGHQSIPWNRWSAEDPGMLRPVPTRAPLWVLTVLAVHRSLGSHDPARPTHGSPWPLLERMVPAGDAANWADEAGFPLVGQMTTNSTDHPSWSTAWWARLHGHRADPLGRNALHNVAQRPWVFDKEEEAFGRLMDAGADPYLVDANGETPLSLLTSTPSSQEDGLLLLLDALDRTHPDLLWDTPNGWGERPLDQLMNRTWAVQGGGLPPVVERMRHRALEREQRTLRRTLDDAAGATPDVRAAVEPTTGPLSGRAGRPRL